MNACYGTGDRECSRCPYDKYNDQDFYGEGGAYCMERLNEDALKWSRSMEMFCNCADCMCWDRNRDENGEWRFVDENEKNPDGYCTVWKTLTLGIEYCSRGGLKE